MSRSRITSGSRGYSTVKGGGVLCIYLFCFCWLGSSCFLFLVVFVVFWKFLAVVSWYKVGSVVVQTFKCFSYIIDIKKEEKIYLEATSEHEQSRKVTIKNCNKWNINLI